MEESTDQYQDKIIKFINRFHSSTNNIDEIFTQGCCYWFAAILCARFNPFAHLMYNEIDNHFAVLYHEHLYDITGDITNQLNDFIPYNELNDEALEKRIERDCIYF